MNTGQQRIAAAAKSLQSRLDKWTKELERPHERIVIAHPDVCIWLFRKFSLGYRRYIKIGASRGISMVRLGWVVLTVRV